jgi:nitrous oxide reductase accessory protein NosL
MRRRALLAALAAALLGAGCGGAHRSASPPARANARGDVTELKDMGQLRSAFNAHPDVPRLIVLASPT